MIVERLSRLQAGDDRIGDVRGRGAMIAIELVKSGTADPDPELTGNWPRRPRGRRRDPDLRHVRQRHPLLPPLTISHELLTEGLDVLAGLLGEL